MTFWTNRKQIWGSILLRWEYRHVQYANKKIKQGLIWLAKKEYLQRTARIGTSPNRNSLLSYSNKLHYAGTRKESFTFFHKGSNQKKKNRLLILATEREQYFLKLYSFGRSRPILIKKFIFQSKCSPEPNLSSPYILN